MNPVLALIIANIIWGAAAPIFKFSIVNVPIGVLLFLRLFLPALLFLPWLNPAHFKALNRSDWVKLFAGSFLAFSINLGMFFLGLERTASIYAPVIASAGPVFLFLISVLILKQKFKAKVFFGMIIALVGVFYIVINPLLGSKHVELVGISGNLFYIASTFSNILAAIVLKDVLKKLSPQELCFSSFLISGISFLPFFLHDLQHWSFGQLDIHGFTGIIFGIYLSSALAYYLFFKGISKILTEEIGIFTYIDPIVAIIIAFPLLHEHPDSYFLVGSALILLGIYIGEGRIQYHPFHLFRRRYNAKD